MTANRQDGICATEHQIQARDRPGVTQEALPKQLKWTRSISVKFRSNSVKIALKNGRFEQKIANICEKSSKLKN